MASSSLARNREFMLLWSGQVLSSLGSRATAVAYPLLVLALTHSPAKAGLVGFAVALPTVLLALPAGALADRVNRKRLMIACDGVRAVALASIPLALLLGDVPYVLVVAVAFIDGAGFTIMYVSERGVVRQLVAPEHLGEAMARNESRTFGALLAGPPLGGLLFGLARALPFLFDALSYAASTTSMLLIRSDFQEERTGAEPAGVREGLRWLWRRPFFRGCSLLFAGGNPLLSGLYLLLVLLAKRDGASSLLVGVMLAVAASGGLIGALLAPALLPRLRPHTVLMGEAWTMAAAIPLLLPVHNAVLLGLIFAAATVITPVTNAIVFSQRVALAPDHLQGRVDAAWAVIAFAGSWIGPLVVGFLLQGAGAAATILALTGWALLLAICVTALPAFRMPPSTERAESIAPAVAA